MLTYLPAFFVLIGAIMVAIGTFWSGYRQSNFTAEIRKKNEQISKMQEENIANLRGADYLTIFVNGPPNADGKFQLTAMNSNDLPIYDVYFIIYSRVDMPTDTPEQKQEAMRFMMNPDKYEIGNLARQGVKNTGIFLEPGWYQIDIRTRYAKYVEMLGFSMFNGVLGRSVLVKDYQGNILSQSVYPERYGKAK